MVRILPTRRRIWCSGAGRHNADCSYSSGRQNGSWSAGASGVSGLFHTNFSRSASGARNRVQTPFRD